MPGTACSRASASCSGRAPTRATGSMAVPRTVEIDNLAQWSGAYFGSRFTHSNLGRHLCRHPQGFLGMWRDLAGKKHFPVEYLIPKESLRETLCKNSRYIA